MTRNYDVFVGCFEIGIGAIVKHAQHIGIIRAFVSLELIKFSEFGRQKKVLGCGLLGGEIGTQPDTMGCFQTFVN